MMAIASAPPSTGSVPAPASSSRTSAGSRERPIHRDDVRDVPENVLRLSAIDCSSPMSANTELKHRDLRAAGGRNQQARLRHERQQAGGLERDGLATGVRAGDDQDADRRNQQDVDRDGSAARHRSAFGARSSSADAARTAGISSGCRAARSSSRRPWRGPARRRPPGSRSAPAPAGRRARSPRRPSAAVRRRAGGTHPISASRIRRTSSCSCCSSATMSLLISTVLSGSRNRLAPLPELPCTMPGIAVRCSARTTST